MDRRVDVSLRVNRIYDRPTVQGEGPYCGRRCTFVRLWGCNLHCAWCDSAETWDTRGLNGIEYPRAENCRSIDVRNIVADVQALGVDLCIITGGEPLLQAERVRVLAKGLQGLGISTHVETNGTCSSGPIGPWVQHYVVSPKLASALAGANSINEAVLHEFAVMPADRATFKFVVMSDADVDEAYELCERFGVQFRARWAMPQGRNASEVHGTLATIADHALERGFNLSPRLHIDIWGQDRGR